MGVVVGPFGHSVSGRVVDAFLDVGHDARASLRGKEARELNDATPMSLAELLPRATSRAGRARHVAGHPLLEERKPRDPREPLRAASSDRDVLLARDVYTARGDQQE